MTANVCMNEMDGFCAAICMGFIVLRLWLLARCFLMHHRHLQPSATFPVSPPAGPRCLVWLVHLKLVIDHEVPFPSTGHQGPVNMSVQGQDTL
jgi:hypothetical protein